MLCKQYSVFNWGYIDRVLDSEKQEKNIPLNRNRNCLNIELNASCLTHHKSNSGERYIEFFGLPGEGGGGGEHAAQAARARAAQQVARHQLCALERWTD